MESTTYNTQLWLDSPIVRMAIKRAGGTAAGAAIVLEELTDLLDELEGMFPGIPFQDILGENPTPEGRKAVGRRLLENGLSKAEVAKMVHVQPERLDEFLASGNGSGVKPAELFVAVKATVVEMYNAGQTKRQIAETLGVGLTVVYRHLQAAGLGRPLTDHQREVGQYAIDHGVKATIDHFEMDRAQAKVVRLWRHAILSTAQAAA